jgi:hypothetical protein
MARLRMTRVVLAAAHFDRDPPDNRLESCVVFVSAAT